MGDYRAMYDRDYLYAFDLDGRDVTVTIREVVAGTLTSAGGRKAKKPVVYFEKTDKGLALNKTNGKVIAQLYGTKTEAWIGKQITLYPTTTQMGGETVECVRVRPTVPRRQQRPAQQPKDPPKTNGADHPADAPDAEREEAKDA